MSDAIKPGEDGKVNTRHSLTGKLQRATLDQVATNPDYLEIVADDAKPYEPGMFKPGKVGEFKNPEPKADVAEDEVTSDAAPKAGHAEGASK